MLMTNVDSFSSRSGIRGVFEDLLCLLAVTLGLLFSQGCAAVQPASDITAPTETTERPVVQFTEPTAKKKPIVQTKLPQTGMASWYGPGFHGRPTASGGVYDQRDLTAAHRKLPFGTKVKVTNLDNGKSVEVEINDRGPFKKNRIIDLSAAAAKALEMKKWGTKTVRVDLASDGP